MIAIIGFSLLDLFIMFILQVIIDLWTFQVGGLLTKAIVRFLLPQQKHSSSIISPDLSSSKSLNLPLLGINGQEPEGNLSTNVTRPSSLRMLFCHTLGIGVFWVSLKVQVFFMNRGHAHVVSS